MFVVTTLTRGRNWSKSCCGILQHHWRPTPPSEEHCWHSKSQSSQGQRCGKAAIVSVFHQWGRSYRGAVQLHSVQLQCARCVEKTEFGFALFQPARMQTFPLQLNRKTQIVFFFSDQLTGLLVLWVEILHPRQEVLVLLRNEVTLGGVSRPLGWAVVPHLRCR